MSKAHSSNITKPVLDKRQAIYDFLKNLKIKSPEFVYLKVVGDDDKNKILFRYRHVDNAICHAEDTRDITTSERILSGEDSFIKGSANKKLKFSFEIFWDFKDNKLPKTSMHELFTSVGTTTVLAFLRYENVMVAFSFIKLFEPNTTTISFHIRGVIVDEISKKITDIEQKSSIVQVHEDTGMNEFLTVTYNDIVNFSVGFTHKTSLE
jgi:hypothetical protein